MAETMQIESLRRRVARLQAAREVGTGGDAVDVTIHKVDEDGVIITLKPKHWQQYRREHPTAEFIAIREWSGGERKLSSMGIVPRWDGGTRIKRRKRWINLPGGGER